MKQRLSLWYRARTPREHALTGGALLIAAAILVWAAILVPFSNAKTASRVRYEAAALALGKARGEAAVRQAPAALRTGPALTAPPAETLRQAAAEAGFPDARVTAAGARTGISIDAARPEAAFSWVRQIETRGLRVVALRAAANPDRTIRIEAAFEAQPR
ncbi:MAG TPA: type II secretion system protein GspM [Allosphingosinicella sp.]